MKIINTKTLGNNEDEIEETITQEFGEEAIMCMAGEKPRNPVTHIYITETEYRKNNVFTISYDEIMECYEIHMCKIKDDHILNFNSNPDDYIEIVEE